MTKNICYAEQAPQQDIFIFVCIEITHPAETTNSTTLLARCCVFSEHRRPRSPGSDAFNDLGCIGLAGPWCLALMSVARLASA